MNNTTLSQRIKSACRALWFFILFVCTGGILLGCATTSDIPSSQQQTEIQHQIPEGKSLVYFYYTRKYLLGTTAVALDEKSSPIEKDSYVLWEIEPGEHQLTFTFHRKWYQKTIEKTIACKPNQHYFFYLYPYTENDEPQHKILQASSNSGQKKIRQFRLIHRFNGETL
ncbi:MAG: hypothetical protein RBT80_10595 [Candidatus Vecturithrix sp.]|jgi:hypothetical protein|nr:hypothetical protein [Candidatus Vecturithrix sp.]